jgi:hypothetical protein
MTLSVIPVANIPASTSRRFNPSDYPKAQEWFKGRFLSALNLFTDPVFVALTNGLTFVQNFNAQYYSLVFTAGATPADNKFSFKQTITGSPIEVIKASCNVSSDPTVPLTAAVDFSWYADSGVVFVTAVSGLTAGTSYRLTVRVC